MPTYTYFDTINNEELSLFQSMAEREQFLIDNPYIHQTLVNTNAYLDPMLMGKMNKEGKAFKTNVLDRIRDTVPGNNLKQSRFNQNLGEI